MAVAATLQRRLAISVTVPTKALLLPPLITSLTLLAMPPALALALA
jgi:hypothetical protein